MTKSTLTSPTALVFFIVGAAVVATIALGLFLSPSKNSGTASLPTESDTAVTVPGELNENANTGTVGAVWQNQSVANAADEHRQTGAPDTIPFSADALYEALQNVRIDENGDVVLDHEALEALNRTLQYGNVPLSSQNLNILQELIKVGVPGKAGEQTAEIVVDYYQYLGAKEEFTAMSEAQGAPTDMTTEDYAQQYEELQALRTLYLGEEVASKLFAQTDANARYMFKAQKLESDTSLSSDEKAKQLEKLNEELVDDTIPVDNWRPRYDAFLAEKQRIVNAGLAEQAKQEQIEQLMKQHFSAEELDKVDYLEIGRF